MHSVLAITGELLLASGFWLPAACYCMSLSRPAARDQKPEAEHLIRNLCFENTNEIHY